MRPNSRFLLTPLLLLMLALGLTLGLSACGGDDDQQDQQQRAAQITAQPQPEPEQQVQQPASQDAMQQSDPDATQSAQQQQAQAQAPTAVAKSDQQQQAQPQPAAQTQQERPQLIRLANVRSGAIDDYSPGVDYFPERASINDAVGFAVDYFDSYKTVRVFDTSRPDAQTQLYILNQRGAPAPNQATVARALGESIDGWYVVSVDVPLQSIFSGSTTQLPALDAIGMVDRLSGVGQTAFVNTPSVRERIDAGEITEFAGTYSVDAEIVLAAAPDALFTSGFWDDAYDVIAPTTAIIHNLDWLEITPLARTEWVKFMAVFFNAEAAAEDWYGEISGNYQTLAADIAAALGDGPRPTVHTGTVYGGIWYASGGRSYVADLIADAGGDYVWSDDESTGSIEIDLEAQLAQAGDADIWLHAASWWTTSDDAIAEDARYGEFASLQNGAVWLNTLATSALGGNDIFERGVARPDLVLADLVSILQPEIAAQLLPDHELIFYLNLPAPAESDDG